MTDTRTTTSARGVLLSVAQAAGGIAAGAGLFMVAGLAWGLLVIGVLVFAVAVLAEITRGA
ncbi:MULTISPECIES: hypothetical protein [Amycolatopsis]|uniref:hypothetical protein n=1 Tax=Amycolatopsis TaxID=1813 RepID=UPI000B8AD410|nr:MULTISPECIES: hypothetical protein [Amycolatopsis]OXM73080.1 hypothetical protein CF166_11195 [Amycolatopsis sp. KNN50.9b]